MTVFYLLRCMYFYLVFNYCFYVCIRWASRYTIDRSLRFTAISICILDFSSYSFITNNQANIIEENQALKMSMISVGSAFSLLEASLFLLERICLRLLGVSLFLVRLHRLIINEVYGSLRIKNKTTTTKLKPRKRIFFRVSFLVSLSLSFVLKRQRTTNEKNNILP